MVWTGLAWPGLAWSGLVWFGLDGFCSAWPIPCQGLKIYGAPSVTRMPTGIAQFWFGLFWLGLVWSGLVWPGLEWSGPASFGLDWPGLANNWLNKGYNKV